MSQGWQGVSLGRHAHRDRNDRSSSIHDLCSVRSGRNGGHSAERHVIPQHRSIKWSSWLAESSSLDCFASQARASSGALPPRPFSGQPLPCQLGLIHIDPGVAEAYAGHSPVDLACGALDARRAKSGTRSPSTPQTGLNVFLCSLLSSPQPFCHTSTTRGIHCSSASASVQYRSLCQRSAACQTATFWLRIIHLWSSSSFCDSLISTYLNLVLNCSLLVLSTGQVPYPLLPPPSLRSS